MIKGGVPGTLPPGTENIRLEIWSELLKDHDEDVEDVLPLGAGAAALRSTINSDFPGFPLKMQQMVLQGGEGFRLLFKILRFQATYPK